MSAETSKPLEMPSLESLPGSTASLEELLRFTRAFDPTLHFRQRWPENYKTEVEALWHRCVQSYKAGTPASAGPDELLMCMAYDCVLGPYLGVPEPQKAQFLQWLVDGMRKGLTRAV